MLLLSAMLLVLMGVLAAPEYLTKPFKNAEPYLNQIQPYQAIAGVVGCIVGCLLILRQILTSGADNIPLLWLATLISAVLLTATSFILGYSKLSNLLAKNATSKEKSQLLLQKLTPLQNQLGLASIISGGALVILAILF